MTNAAYEKITQLQYRCRHAEQRVKSLESGAEHRKLRLGMKRQRRYYEHLLKRKDREIARLSRQISSNREMWFQVYEDIQKEYEDRLSKAGRAIEKILHPFRYPVRRGRRLVVCVLPERAGSEILLYYSQSASNCKGRVVFLRIIHSSDTVCPQIDKRGG